MNVNSASNTTINYIMGIIKSKAPVSQEALDTLEAALRQSVRPEFDTVEISGLKSSPGDERIVSMIDEECVNFLGYVHLRKDNLKSSVVFTNEQVSERAEALAWLMNENNPSFIPKDGLRNSLVTKEQLAQHLGDIGRRIDECFAAGEITRQEYDDLNAGLKKFTEVSAAWLERQNAICRFAKDMNHSIQSMRKHGASDIEIEAFAKEKREDFHKNINEFIRKFCAIDRDLLLKLVQRVRGGKDLIPGSSRQTDDKDKTVGYSNGYGPFVPGTERIVDNNCSGSTSDVS